MRVWSVFVLVLLFTSCKNDLSEDIVDTSRSKTLAQYLFLDAFRQVLSVVPEFVAEGDKSGLATTISSNSSFSGVDYPKVITIDYGQVSQQDDFGISRRGKVLVTILSKEITKGAFKIAFDDFYLNDTKMLGELSSSYVGSVSNDSYDLVLTEGCKISNENGTMSLNGSLSLRMTAGKQTFEVFDDIYKLTEQTKGQDFSGISYSANSTTDFTLDFSCRWIVVAGIGEVSPSEVTTQKINLGDGNCDGVVTVDVGEGDLISFQVK